MADRPYRGGRGHRGGRGGGRGGGGGGVAAAGAGGGGAAGQERERPKKENILDLKKYMDKRITVKFNGGREGSFRFVSYFLASAKSQPPHSSPFLPSSYCRQLKGQQADGYRFSFSFPLSSDGCLERLRRADESRPGRGRGAAER